MSKFPFEKRKYEILRRVEERTNPDWGKPPQERTPQELLDYGLIVINKPAGPT